MLGGAYVILPLCCGSFGIHGSTGAGGTLDTSGIMTPWALENVSIYTEYGSVEAALAAGKTFHLWAKPMLDSFIFLGGTGRR